MTATGEMEEMDHVLQIELDRYIHEVYVPREREKSPGPAAEEKGQDPFYLGGEGLSLSDLVLKVGETFHEMLFRKIAESGMSEAEAKSLLLAGGCTEDGSGYFIWGSVAAVRLTVENGTVTKITACLRPSTNLTNIEIRTN